MLPTLTATAWILLVVVAALCGIAKTALPGAATIAVALCTAALPAKESTGAILLMLMTGDLLAVWSYRSDAVHRATAMVAAPGRAVLAMPHRAATTTSRIQAVVVKVGSTGPLSDEKSRGVV